MLIMNEIYVLLYIISNLALNVKASGVLGCGGFIKTHVPIDFSKIEVKLLTKQGILKDKTNCAPNNGYYFVPLYDKGEYTLQLEPPAGWSFSPNKIDLNVDGINDLCSKGKDINFSFKGFGITGRVESLGSFSAGPKGVSVQLKSNSETRNTETDSNGSFFFTPVYPGTYTVAIKHPKWKILKSSLSVVVTEGNTDLPAKSFLIQGYEIKGIIRTENDPIYYAILVLYHESDKKESILVDGCNKDVESLKLKEKNALCFVRSNPEGVFSFKTVPFGKYYIKPYFKDQNIHFRPEKIQFAVGHDDVLLQEAFELIGFSTIGRVFKSEKGNPIQNAKIYLDGKLISKTDSSGSYKIEKLIVGTYKIRAEADGYIFNDMEIKVTPHFNTLPNLFPSAVKTCGKVMSDQKQIILISKVGSNQVLHSETEADGSFCEYLTPGKYHFEIKDRSKDEETKKTYSFYPLKHVIDVENEPINNIVFSQLKANVNGEIKCFRKEDCKGLKVILKSTVDSSQKLIINVENNKYKTSNIYPGTYQIALASNNLCWKQNQLLIEINSANVDIPDFIQTGYNVNFLSSHDTKIIYKVPGSPTELSKDLTKGQSSFCLPKFGDYQFKMDSCHFYEPNTVNYKTEIDAKDIILTALKHTITLAIESDNNYGPLAIAIKIGSNKNIIQAHYANKKYSIKLLLSSSESAVINPQSEILYINPPILQINGEDDCTDLGVKFKAVKGKVFKGKVVPALAGVLLTVESENADSLTVETDEQGLYKFPPLDQSKQYKISAKKDSYIFSGPTADGVFNAHKLAEIIVEVLAEDKTPLQGALLSLSGGESYRSNLQTNENGKITFHSLSPSEYFLRPMMKEYQFEPNSKIIQVKEGKTVNVQLIGKRVAYSAFGQITSLNGAPEENMLIIAYGLNNCSHLSEEAASESSGNFRIRGLQPYCDYEVKVKSTSESTIERSSPSSIKIHIDKNTKDIEDLKFIVFRPVSNMDVLVKVTTENLEHYKHLKVKLIRESSPSAVIHTSKLDTLVKMPKQNYGALLHLPTIPIDRKTYAVQLEATMPNVNYKPQVVSFVANSSFQFISLHFKLISNATEQHIKQTSVWALVLVFGIIFSLYHIEFIVQMLRKQFGAHLNNLIPNNFGSKKSNEYFDNAEIDQIVQSINNLKKKPKQKKN